MKARELRPGPGKGTRRPTSNEEVPVSGRTTISVAAAMLLLATVGVSDAEGQRPIRFGIIGGANITGAWGDDADDTDTRTGFDAGALVQIPVGEMVTIQPEVHYTQKGYTRDLVTGEEALILPCLARSDEDD